MIRRKNRSKKKKKEEDGGTRASRTSGPSVIVFMKFIEGGSTCRESFKIFELWKEEEIG